MRVDDAAQLYCFQVEGSAAYVKGVTWAIKKFTTHFHGCEVEQLTYGELARWLEGLRKEDGTRYSPATLQNIIVPVKALYKFLHDEGIVAKNTAAKLPSYSHYPRQSKAPDSAAFQQLVNAIPWFVDHRSREPIDIRDAAIVSLAVDCAGRRAALWDVEIGEVKKALFNPIHTLLTDGELASVVNVYSLKSRGKGLGVTAELRFYDQTATLLAEYLKVRPQTDCVKLFVSHQKWSNYGGQLAMNNITKAFVRLCEFAEVPIIRSHAVRHRTLTDLVLHGTDINTVAKYAGHSDVKTTMRHYIHIPGQHVDQAGAALSLSRQNFSRTDGLADELFKGLG